MPPRQEWPTIPNNQLPRPSCFSCGMTGSFSFVLQIFLLLTENLRHQRINVLLKVLIWLPYVGADFVTVYALGFFIDLLAFGDTLPFLWVPFLILHLSGQDSTTAYSIENNNLWIRHLVNLVIQMTLPLYVFQKSSMIPSLVLAPETPWVETRRGGRGLISPPNIENL
ncbi:hypothetical protein U9M48_040927, partial [Paspalum notatum var. saurae]